ncbi:uncharacterized protein VTP21DRAFT_5274 [Calcarisporiella thermophila]|uniref:uncharacterized protein n=1 Tax=Calcarisporiella thermophila TaxID=911321 RepID=UPI0037442211
MPKFSRDDHHHTQIADMRGLEDDLESVSDHDGLLSSDPVVKAQRCLSSRRRRIIVVLTLAGVLLLTLIIGIQFRPVGGHENLEKKLVKVHTGAVAAEVIECSEIGVEILKKGGNAVDAAIASGLCVGSINMFSSGIGGGGFMLIRSANGSSELIDFREEAPIAANKSMYIHDPKLAQTGGLSVGVPGEIKGFELAHSRHGKLPWKDIFAPIIALNRYGVKVGPELARRIRIFESLLSTGDWAATFAPNGTLLAEGDLLLRPNLANTLETIANEGADAFYTGKIADHLIERIQSTGGVLTREDFAAYRAIIREPISTYYHGRKIITGPAPTSGPVLIAVLNILERYNLKVGGLNEVNLHRIVEAFKHGFAARTELGDPEYINNKERMAEILTKGWADRVRRNISDERTFDPLYYNPKYDTIENHGTTHLSVVDKDGMAVSLTSTVNLEFGSKVIDPVTGVILNDEMDDFSIPGQPNEFNLYPSPFNYPTSHKRPLSSSVPTFVERDGNFELVLGASGGSRIITATLDVLLNVLDFNMDLLHAVETSRVHHQLLPNVAVVESGFPAELIEGLVSRGHNVTIRDIRKPLSEVQAVQRISDTIYAVSDSRKHGIAAGY